MVLPMAHRESLEDLLITLAPTEGWEAFAKRAQVTARTLQTYRQRGTQRPHQGTVALLSIALGCNIERVRAAIAESHRRWSDLI